MDRIPILRMGSILLVTIQVDMYDHLAMTLQDDLTKRIAETGAHGVLIDISSLDIVDSFMGRVLSNISLMASVLDAATVVVGMRPAVAITLVELGLSLHGVKTALNVERGMDVLHAAMELRSGRDTMPVEKSDTMQIRSEQDVVSVRRAVKTWSEGLSFSVVDQTKMVTAASELGRNTFIYGGGGDATLEVLRDGGRKGLRITFHDAGPGIPDVARAMQDGYTTGKGMGFGLSGAKRLVNEFTIVSRLGEGTTISITRWK